MACIRASCSGLGYAAVVRKRKSGATYNPGNLVVRLARIYSGRAIVKSCESPVHVAGNFAVGEAK